MSALKERVVERQVVTRFAANFLSEWNRLGLPISDARLLVAVSGGADSTALILVLSELTRTAKLSLDLTIAHFDHGLRETSEQDAEWVQALGKRLGIDVKVGHADVAELAASDGDNLEQAARLARYEFLRETANDLGAGLIVTGHTMDDQAETVLFRLMRGSGATGLAGIQPVRPLCDGGSLLLARPLLAWARKADAEKYCVEQGADFRLDEMNDDSRFSRVRIRGQLIPLMQSFNPKVVEVLCRTAALLREDDDELARAANQLLEAAAPLEPGTSETPFLRVNVLSGASAAVRKRALRIWIERNRGNLRRLERVHVEAVDGLLRGQRGGRVVQLPGGATVRRERGFLRFGSKLVENSSIAV
jgi:tRNA(Ile)-lysidine synthase